MAQCRAHLWTCACALLLVSSALSVGPAVGAGRPYSGSATYMNPERTSFLSVKNGNLTVGPIPPRNRLGRQNDIFADETAGAPAEDCSDTIYLCMRSSTAIFAVPRKQISPGSNYLVQGTIFNVVKCVRGVGKKCQVALIEADCQVRNIRSETCEPGTVGARANAERGPVNYFIFNEDIGVTSIGLDTERKTGIALSSAGRDYVLQGDTGLLNRD